MFKPQHLLVEERGLGNQIKRLKDLIPSKQNRKECFVSGQTCKLKILRYVDGN